MARLRRMSHAASGNGGGILLPAPVLTIDIDTDDGSWEYTNTNPYAWRFEISEDSGISWTFYADIWPGTLRAHAAFDSGRYRMFGVTAFGDATTEKSNEQDAG